LIYNSSICEHNWSTFEQVIFVVHASFRNYIPTKIGQN